MVNIRVEGDSLILEPLGWHKCWAMKRRLMMPLSPVERVRRAQLGPWEMWWPGIRVPGTHLPGLFVAGSYYTWSDRRWSWWDVRPPERAIEITFVRERYSRAVVEVADPEAAIRLIELALADDASNG